MNIQNPSFAQHQHASGYGQPQSMASESSAMAQFGADVSQNQFQLFPNTPARLSQLNPQLQNQIPPQLYQQLQQQQQQQQQQQAAGFVRPQSRDNFGVAQGQQARQPSANLHQHSQSIGSQGNAPGTPAQRSSATQNMSMNMTPNMGMNMTAASNMQQSPAATQARNLQAQATPPLNPQVVAREEERVSTLLEINSHLIREVTNLQAQGKAGSQPTPASPAADGTNIVSNSPIDAAKKGVASQEYADCMRRLQANLAYLAAIADASKKAGQRPVGPAIMIPPTHLVSVHPLYQKLKGLFPEASQSTLNKAMAVANAQAARAASGQQSQPQAG